MNEIIARAKELLLPGGIVVINCILLESLYESLRALKEHGFSNINYLQAAIARSRELGGGTVLQPLNPVFIVSASKGAV
jgi:precorrin-6B methylase 2